MSIISWLKNLFVDDHSEMVSEQNADSKPLDFSIPTKPTNSVPHEPYKASTNTVETDSQTESKLEELAGKAKDFMVETGKEVADQGSELWNSVKDKMKDLDEGTKEFREGIKNKANEALEKIDDLVEKTIEKGKALESKEKELDADNDGFADKKIDFGKSVEEKHEDFFDKADQWIKNHNTEYTS
ncbi:MAG: hypothetical protein ABIO44_03140, partial [Saprospiraceae bacterium]